MALDRCLQGGKKMETLWEDLRYGARMMLKRPGLTAAALVALTLGIGANCAIFSVINAVLLRPLPFKNPDQLMLLLSARREESKISGGVSHADYMDWREQSKTFEDLATFYTGGFKITGE